MGHGIRKTRYLSEIRTLAELREARREVELREFFTRERLLADVEETFSFDNLLSIVAPPGSLMDRVIGGVETGLGALQGVLGLIGGLFGHEGASDRRGRR